MWAHRVTIPMPTTKEYMQNVSVLKFSTISSYIAIYLLIFKHFEHFKSVALATTHSFNHHMSILRGKKNSAAIENLVGVWEEQLEYQGMSKR